MIKGIHHASFTVSNMETSIAFYRDLLGMKVLWDSAQAGVKFKGEASDRITGCPGTEQRLVYLGINDRFLELVEYTPAGKPLRENKASDVGSAHLCFLTDDIHGLTRSWCPKEPRYTALPRGGSPFSSCTSGIRTGSSSRPSRARPQYNGDME